MCLPNLCPWRYSVCVLLFKGGSFFLLCVCVLCVCVCFYVYVLLSTYTTYTPQVVVGKGIRSTFRWQSKDLSCSVREFLSNLFAQTGLEEVQYAATNEGRLIVPGPAVHALFCALQSRGEKLDALDMHGYIVPA